MSNEEVYTISDTAFIIGNFAVEAMLYEVACYPSPGLVSPVSNGAHKDMNYFSFIDSTMALSKYFTLFAQKGLGDSSYKEIFKGIRRLGIDAEKEMFAKTKGVNTHKGMLFLMGISCAAVAKAIYEKRDFHEIQHIIKMMTKGIVKEELSTLDQREDLSHGERLYLRHKITGIRGEVEAGIPTVFDFSLDFYKACSHLSINDRLIHTLLGIMQICDDSTILYRHSPHVLEEVKEKSREIIANGGMQTPVGKEKINELSMKFIERNISPGGSADLLGVTVFFYLVEEYMKKST
ncbi:triphosphoribosyl-dephospho-CoA synthase [Anaerovirgula multivorans]|uniref:Probable 2-(5''-triphosphoribosyl)-3'-dephosphocoenzyme-A synthase n=1 Tax=Anaerovirgula multivorans TaxID=312168 RepID=A0A239FRU6_9FIRM|nr:triphosphoribosyl-dephospho-CoA synthase CitG [Anaerovirgula multivorans]SNS59590.1 triphosphoribosyl-dephospho-CoA synthase [Anaerovirgula multivorans]